MSTRILKAHREAVKQAMQDNAKLAAVGDWDQYAHNLAEAALTAQDNLGRPFVVAVKDPVAGSTLIFGPYPTQNAAIKAVKKGWTGISPGTTEYRIYPVLKTPPRGSEDI